MDKVGFDMLRPAFAAALEKKGFSSLTSVQQAVLEPALAGRDLRITSQTGSGKTLAIGLVVADMVDGVTATKGGVAKPRVMVVAPTRELAKQVEEELAWLYAAAGASVTSVTGGASIRDERRALAGGPAVVVGTPGRLLDHLKRGGIDASQVGAIVLDEADRMLDLGFREDLLAILEHAPPERRTHLVSATFPRDVRALADRVQKEPAHVEGTKLGTANTDIEHVIHLVDSRQRLDAIVNLLLATPEAQTLVFARTRADVAHMTRDLEHAGFSVGSLSGEMEQAARNRALAAFKRGSLHALIATDVAARGIDVQDIARVIHAEPPSDADAYTHRSGRTGRAGRKGTSSILV
ncbi:MAG TPA: DEAD/DEAH box helicase, partial [Polyangiaceae bacterium]|nr:DEAD/DEAH box helicase [Polyangiaceae bacterium]